MYAKKIGMFVILSLSIATLVMGTAGLNLVSPVFAGGDHGHGHDGKKCKNNDDNNCNDTHKTQKIYVKNDCEIENTNKDHSHDNLNVNNLTCANSAQNLKDVLTENVFGDGGG
jgi:hypothetical protein